MLACLIMLLFCPQVMEKPIFLILLFMLVPLIFALNISILINTNHHKQTDKEKLEKCIKNKKQCKYSNIKLFNYDLLNS